MQGRNQGRSRTTRAALQESCRTRKDFAGNPCWLLARTPYGNQARRIFGNSLGSFRINKSCLAAGVRPHGGLAAPSWQVALAPAVGSKVSHFLPVGKMPRYPDESAASFSLGNRKAVVCPEEKFSKMKKIIS
jgi:hypothetical protein